MFHQRTLRTSVHFHGIGLHSGVAVDLRLLPAPAGSGITFVRTDVTPHISIPAIITNVVNTRLSTTIGARGYAVAAIEHLMAALFATGVDNVRAEVNGAELPILDGSSLPFVQEICRAGTVEVAAPRRVLVVTRPVRVAEGRSILAVYPSDDFRISCTIRFRHRALITRSRHYQWGGEEDVLNEYAPARTFGFLHEVDYLKANGFARGGSLANAVIIGDNGVLNDDGLRFPDEPVRHKMLDLMGDLMLAGHRIIGHVRAFRSGHFLNCKLVEHLLASHGSCARYADWEQAAGQGAEGGKHVQPSRQRGPWGHKGGNYGTGEAFSTTETGAAGERDANEAPTAERQGGVPGGGPVAGQSCADYGR